MRNLSSAGLMSRGRLVAPLLAAMVVAACGGGGGGGGSVACLPYETNTSCTPTSGGSTGSTQTATQMTLTVDTPSIQTNGSSVVTVSATLKDSQNAVVSGQKVSFTADSGTISASTATTDANGVASITFNSSGDKTNRTVNFTATSNGLSQATSVVVQGTRIGFGGDTSAVSGKPVSMSVTLLDGAAKAIAGQVVTLSSKLGNSIPGSVKTDANGQATINFTPTVAGTDTITASALGATLTQDIVVSAVNFAFSSPAADTVVNIDSCQPVSVQLLGTTVTAAKFTVSRGLVYADAACASGSALQVVPFSGTSATAYVKSPSAGSATVYAELSGGASAAQASLAVKFVATVPKYIFVQGDPSVVMVDGSSSITALVKDVNGNPVAGQSVVFSAPNGGGVPNPTTAVTNDSGVASTTFKADSSISGKDSVSVKATVVTASSTIEQSAQLTVGGKAVNIVIGTVNKIVLIDSPPRYRSVWGVLISDPASGPIKNQVVTISLRGTRFDKGQYWVDPAGGTKWTPKSPITTCWAEDANNNGVVDAGEIGDADKDGILEPNGSAVVRSSTSTGGQTVTVTTDESGAAEFWVEYLREYASWVEVELKATANVTGTNNWASRTFYLPISAAEVLDKDVSPSFQVSPFGIQPVCYLH